MTDREAPVAAALPGFAEGRGATDGGGGWPSLRAREERPLEVLLIEDNPGDRDLVLEYLADAGMEHVVTAVSRMAEAKAALGRDAFDAILLDLHLPDATGVDALRAVQEAAPHTPVVVLTGTSDRALARECLQAGADDYLPKAALSAEGLERALGYACARAVARALGRKLEHADRLTVIGKLAVTVAHEINNPLASLTLNLGSLRRFLELLGSQVSAESQAMLPATLREELAPLQDAAEDCVLIVQRVSNIVKNLRALAHPRDEQAAWVDVGDLCRRVGTVVGATVRQRALFVMALADVPAVWVPGRKLEQIVVNLLINATQAITAGAIAENRVELSTSFRDGVVVISVVDTGCGIPESRRQRIFEPFFSTRGGLDGTGLGLTVSAELAAAMGGRITVESEVGKGSLFELLLPAEAASTAAVATHGEGAASGGTRRRVLVIDDDLALTRSLQRVLGTHHEVRACTGGAEALELLVEGQRFDAILCDLVMPEVDGRSVHRFLRQWMPEMLPRLAFVSGAAATPQLAEFVRAPGVRLIAKPAPVEVLLATIEELATSSGAPRRERRD